jgi:hypothetical protein
VEPAKPFYLLTPQDGGLREEYQQYIGITSFMPVNVLGFQSHRDHFAIAFEKEETRRRISMMRDTRHTDAELAQVFEVPDNRDWQLHAARQQAREDKNWEDKIIACAYRPFDLRSCYFSTVSMDYRSRYAEFLKIDFPRLPLTGNPELFRALARLGGELTALHLLEFEVAQASSLHPKNSQAGGLRYSPITEFIGGRHPEVEKPFFTVEGSAPSLPHRHGTDGAVPSRGTVWIDKAQTTGFQGVREDVWNFHIGGYQVCEKWLKDRKGRTLTKDDLAHYQKIVVALSETIRLMAEIDVVIHQHGGWPGAFAASKA